MVSQLQKLPTDESLGTLEPVAYFNGAMLTGVTVSHPRSPVDSRYGQSDVSTNAVRRTQAGLCGSSE